jgi:tetratricopeptide (TPR) repeat protein
MFNRAIAYLRTDNLPAAQADYLELNRVFPTAYQVYYGLGEIAHRQKDGKAAIRYYESYLSNSIPNSEETKFVSARLAELKAGAR